MELVAECRFALAFQRFWARLVFLSISTLPIYRLEAVIPCLKILFFVWGPKKWILSHDSCWHTPTCPTRWSEIAGIIPSKPLGGCEAQKYFELRDDLAVVEKRGQICMHSYHSYCRIPYSAFNSRKKYIIHEKTRIRIWFQKIIHYSWKTCISV